MFITLQLSFVDLRAFLKYPLKIVPDRQRKLDPELTDLEQIAKSEYVRCFGHFQLRNYVPDFRTKRKKYEYANNDKWDNLDKIWQEEYLYASTRRGLRFEFLEKQTLLGGKLINPRAKIRALRYFPFDTGNQLWTPCMRIETGILFDVTAPLNEGELAQALGEFIKMKVNVPLYTRETAGNGNPKKTNLYNGTLIEQQKVLAKLIVNGTTAHQELRVSEEMIIPGDPLLTVHYTKDEISGVLENCISLPKSATGNAKISFLPLRNPRIGTWLFELPNHRKKGPVKIKTYESIRNITIAIMRYWSEFQAVIGLRNAVTTDAFDFNLKENKRMVNYLNTSTKFLLSGKWHGISLEIIRNILNTYQEADPNRQRQVDKIVKEFPKQIAEKILTIGTISPQIFVSYSHQDKVHLPVIEAAFRRLHKTHQIEFFADTDLEAGEEWEQNINTNLNNASLAVLMVSPNFLASNFITTKELPVISDRYERGKLNVIPILIDGDIPKEGMLAGIQFINANNPLSGSNDEKVKEIVNLLIKRVLSYQEPAAK